MKVSLIITVYNKAPFLRRCLDSVKSQKNHNAQIIVIDDGSTDGSSEICDEYGFEVYHTANQGVSEARNYGLDKATGDYVAFLDADDALTPKALHVMELVAGRCYNIYQFGQYRCRNYEIRNNKVYGSPKGHYDLFYIPKYWVVVWNKLYKRSFLEDNHIRFKKGMQFGEDTLFNAECILANGGLYHAPQATIVHCVDDKDSLCRGHLDLARIENLDKELCKLAKKQTDPDKKRWIKVAINEHRNSKLYKKMGFGVPALGECDVVYFVKDEPENEELRYSLRSVEQNFEYRNVWFCGGCPDGLKPDKHLKIRQDQFTKWDRVRNMIREVCTNEEISDNFWLFNDDFFILKPMKHMEPQYNGELKPYFEYVESKHDGIADGFTIRLRQAYQDMTKAGLTTLNYEVHKPMLINKKKALEVLERFPNTPCFRSLYGNYWHIGGEDKHDMKIKIENYKKILSVQNFWDFVSTDDKSFENGNIGEYLREKFDKKCRFEC